MTNALWRVTRVDHAGKPMAPLDHTSKPEALEAVRRLQDTGCQATMQQWDAFRGEWTEYET